MPVTLAEEAPEDWWEVEQLFDLSFAPGRSALSSYRLRADVAPIGQLCLTARDADGVLAGALRNWPVRAGGAPTVLLGPIAVHPTRQGEGIAAILMNEGLDRARDAGWDRVLLVGDAPYYSRFGFTKLENVTMPPPTNPDRVLGVALRPEAWRGIKGFVTRW